VRTLLPALIAALLMAGCSSTPEQENRMPPASPSAEDALKFGGIALPASAKVLGVTYEAGIDERYRVTISVPPGDVPALLSASKFSTALMPDPGPYTKDPLDGFDLTKATDVVAADDTLPPEGDRKQTVVRQVVVDRTDPANSIVHLWMFTT
jgi:hypothetical protein